MRIGFTWSPYSLRAKENTTEIFLSHRSSFNASQQHDDILKNRGVNIYSEESLTIRDYIPDDSEENKSDISNDTKVKDYEINSEILRRLMIKLGATDFDAKEKIERPQEIVKAELINTEQGKFIQMNDPYDRAWRRLSLALDMIGFITEDRDRSKGIFYVKYKDIELPAMEESEKDKGLIDSLLFWRDEDEAEKEKLKDGADDSNVEESGDKDEELFSEKSWDEKFPILKFWGSDEEKKPDDEFRYRVRISPMGDFTKVYLDFPDGSLNNSKESQQIIKIIFEQLK